MTGGLRIAGAAMTNFARRHDVIANNLANVSTPGFARQDTFVQRLEKAGTAPFEAPSLRTRTDFTAGPPILTGNPMDLALEGTGFFTLLGDEGQMFSRVASLHVDSDGFLRDGYGNAVMGENGLLHVGDSQLVVEKDGSILADGRFLDRLQLTTFASGDAIERGPSGMYTLRKGHAPDKSLARPVVHTGQIEGSSVQPVTELVRMIQALRSYEAASSALRATDATLQRAVNDIARV